MLCLLPGTDNEALSSSCHSGEPSMKKERPMPTAQYQTHAGGRKWAEQRNGNLWKKETCEEEEFLRVTVPSEKPQSTNTVWRIRNHQRGPSGLTGTHRAPAFGITRLPPSSHLPRHSSQPGFWGRTEGSRACGGPFPHARPHTPRPAAPRNRTLQPANPQPLQLAIIIHFPARHELLKQGVRQAACNYCDDPWGPQGLWNNNILTFTHS